ncbi:MAG: LytR family transcriptional regulator [Clostridiales bacterium]|nr:LytR family transcriptional regulator [Clostridiales bacterium]
MKKKKHGKKHRKAWKIVVAILAVIVVLILGVVAFTWSKFQKMDKIELKNVKVNKLQPETEKALKGYTTIALFGLDNRSNGNFKSGNSDTIIVVSINNDTGEIKMASVYRDTYLDISENKFRKANAAYSSGGPEQAVNMLNKNLDLNITDYVAVDFNAVVEAVDLLGGIELDVTSEEVSYMNDYIDGVSEVTGKKSHHVSAGKQTCDGVQATAYARIRYTTGWDYKRTERQRTVITKMFEKAKGTDLLTLNKMLDEILPEVSTSLSAGEILNMAGDMTKYHMGENTGFPFDKESTNLGKLGSVVVPVDLENNVIQLHQFLYANESYTPSQTVKDLSKTVHDSTGY